MHAAAAGTAAAHNGRLPAQQQNAVLLPPLTSPRRRERSRCHILRAWAAARPASARRWPTAAALPAMPWVASAHTDAPPLHLGRRSGWHWAC